MCKIVKGKKKSTKISIKKKLYRIALVKSGPKTVTE